MQGTVFSGVDKSRTLLAISGCLLEGVRNLQRAVITVVASDDLDTDRQIPKQ